MRVAVVGGGGSGTKIQQAVQQQGAQCVQLSRRTGFDVRDPRAGEQLSGYDAVIEAVGGTFMRRRPAVEFFTTSTRMIAHAAARSGARHVLLSIVNCDLPEVEGYGYFAAKAEQERIAKEVSHHLTVVRSTQWFEFAAQNQQRMRLGPICIVPEMQIQPVALEAVAQTIAAEVLNDQPRGLVEVAGPETMTLQELTQATCPARPKPLEIHIPTRYGKAFTDGALLATAGTNIIGPTLSDWVRARPNQRI